MYHLYQAWKLAGFWLSWDSPIWTYAQLDKVLSGYLTLPGARKHRACLLTENIVGMQSYCFLWSASRQPNTICIMWHFLRQCKQTHIHHRSRGHWRQGSVNLPVGSHGFLTGAWMTQAALVVVHEGCTNGIPSSVNLPLPKHSSTAMTKCSWAGYL